MNLVEKYCTVSSGDIFYYCTELVTEEDSFYHPIWKETVFQKMQNQGCSLLEGL